MTEYNVYIVDLDTGKRIYLYTTMVDSIADATNDYHIDFYGQEFGISKAMFNVILTEDDHRSRDDLIFDYIIEKDDSISTTSSE